MLPWKLRKRQILPVNQNLSSVYFSPAKFQLVSCNFSLVMIWQMTYTHKLPKLCSATLIAIENPLVLFTWRLVNQKPRVLVSGYLFCWCLDRKNGDPKITWKASLRIVFSLFSIISRDGAA